MKWTKETYFIKRRGMEKVIRYTVPTRYDVAPYGAIVTVVGENDSQKMFIQLGQEEHSHWMGLGDFLEQTFKTEIDDPEFVKGCLSLYKRK
jgi:hypothetical protein